MSLIQKPCGVERSVRGQLSLGECALMIAVFPALSAGLRERLLDFNVSLGGH